MLARFRGRALLVLLAADPPKPKAPAGYVARPRSSSSASSSASGQLRCDCFLWSASSASGANCSATMVRYSQSYPRSLTNWHQLSLGQIYRTDGNSGRLPFAWGSGMGAGVVISLAYVLGWVTGGASRG